MAVRVRLIVEYDWDAEGDTMTGEELAREQFDWANLNVTIEDLYGALANPTITLERAKP